VEVVSSGPETAGRGRIEQRNPGEGGRCKLLIYRCSNPTGESGYWLEAIAIAAEQKGLELTQRPKKNMYIDVAESARGL
jgi:hypothetical protein